MLIVLSPAKTLDFESRLPTRRHTQPDMLDASAMLIEQLRGLPASEIGALMDISEPLAELNAARFRDWQPPFTPANARPAALAFAGDVYEGLQAATLGSTGLSWAQSHVRILSGLYGLLRPLDLIQPYRLEMGTRLANPRGRDLYAFWGDRIAQALREALDAQRRPVLVNLASDEYFRAARADSLGHRVVQPVFQERRGGTWKVVSFSAKRARGLMTRFAAEQRISDPEDLKAFALEGYRHDAAASDERHWLFRREQP
jgi:cytoplasmic iron level regulating protein YaaA (DUF328/UPF0246 family)